jgi:hypothetical protein
MASKGSSAFWQAGDYAAALRTKADERKRYDPRATYQTLASACKVDKAYLSRVLRGDADLSQDQLYLAALHLGIAGLERDFLFALHAHSRSALPARRREIEQELARLRARALETRQHIATGALAPAEEALLAPYFLDPDAQLVHVFLAVERYRRAPASIAAELGLGAERFGAIVDLLRRLQLVEVRADGLHVRREALHLPTSAQAYHPYRLLMRQRALGRASALRPQEGYFFSVLFAASEREERTLRERFLDLLRASEAEVRAAPSKDVYQLSFDLFRWSAEGARSF